jgi:hypothetical protein
LVSRPGGTTVRSGAKCDTKIREIDVFESLEVVESLKVLESLKVFDSLELLVVDSSKLFDSL